MSDVIPASVARLGGQQRARRSYRIGDTIFAAAAVGAALFVLISLGAVALSMLYGGLPAFAKFGFSFLYRTAWDPVRQDFGAAVPIYGTLVTSGIAMAIAVPISFGIAVFLNEVCPPSCVGRSLRRSSCSPAFPASSTACGVCSSSCPSCPITSNPG